MSNNKIRGSLIGGAIGDALGYQIEFKRGVKPREVTRLENNIISDDTQMTLFTANAILWRETRAITKGISPMIPDAIYEGYLDWLDTQNNHTRERRISWLNNVEELNHDRAPGMTCMGSLASGVKGTVENRINNSKGCGGIMRVAPLGLYMDSSFNAGKFAAEASAITHGHDLGILPSYVFASMIHKIVYADMNIYEALMSAMEEYHAKYSIFDKANMKYFDELVSKALELSQSELDDQECIRELGEGWVADEAFAIAIYSCLKYQDSFEDAIICSVNHDGDSDSTGAITGNIMGAYLGIDAIPDYYKDRVELKDIILEIADDLSHPIEVDDYTPSDDPWLRKYLYADYKGCDKNEEHKSYQLKDR